MNNPSIENTLTLESVQHKFETWRSSRTKRERIPEPLWEAAAILCRHLPTFANVCEFPSQILKSVFPPTSPLQFSSWISI